MALITIPPGIRELEWTPPPQAAYVSRSSYSGKQTVIDRGGVTGGWKATATAAPANAAGFLAWSAWSARMRGGVNTVRLPAGINQTACPIAVASVWSNPRRNYLLHSTMFDSAAWTKTGVTTVDSYTDAANLPDGATAIARSWALTENAANSVHQVSQSVTLSGDAVTFSVYIRPGVRSWAQIYNQLGAGAWFNVTTGALGSSSGVTARITDAGNGFFRCSITLISTAGSNTFYVSATTGDGVSTYLGAAGAYAAFIAGAQVEYGSVSSTYIATSAAAVSGFDGFYLVGLTPGVTFLRAGQRVSLRDRLYTLTEDIVGGIDTITNVGVQPDLPTLTSGGEIVALRSPTCLMRLAGPAPGFRETPGRVYFPASFELEEVL